MKNWLQHDARVTAAISFLPRDLPVITIEQTPFDPDEYIRLALHFYDLLIHRQQPEAPRATHTIGAAVFTPFDRVPPLNPRMSIRVLAADRIRLHLYDRGNGERSLLAPDALELPEEVLEKAVFSYVSLIASRFDDSDRELLRDALLAMDEGYDWDETLTGQRAHDVPNHAFFSTLLEREENVRFS